MRKLRLAKGWTLQQLSEKSGVPLSTLSKLELGQSSLTYDKILRICQALDVDPGLSILQQAAVTPSPSARRSIVRVGEGAPASYGHHPVKVAAQDLLSKSFTPMLVTLQPADVSARRQTLPGEVYLYVLQGAAILKTDVYAPLRLNPGDAIFFDGSTEHQLHSALAEPCSALMIVSGDEGFWREEG
ncbi:MAG TPA: XRE family transcriptional regulator [Caulobacterales bacterium]|nr:XRE family transcriptional regulator [Caulobacterales bacterium]